MSKENPVPQTKDRTTACCFERNIFEQLPEHFLKSNNSGYEGFESLFATISSHIARMNCYHL